MVLTSEVFRVQHISSTTGEVLETSPDLLSLETTRDYFSHMMTKAASSRRGYAAAFRMTPDGLYKYMHPSRFGWL